VIRVLNVITSLSVGGAETMLRNVVLGLDRARFEAAVLSLTGKEQLGAELEAAGIAVTALAAKGGVLLPRHLLMAKRFAAAWRPDVIHAWMYHGNVLSYWLQASAVKPRPVLITSVRGALNAPHVQKRMLRVVRRIDAGLSGRASAIIFNSRASAQQHVGIGYAGERVAIIPNGFDVERFSPNLQQREAVRKELTAGDQILIGLVGRFNPLKGHREFLHAASLVAQQDPRCAFVLVGRGCDANNDEIRSWLTSLNLQDRTRLLGERRDIPAVLNALDVVVCPSISESFPNSIGEAMSCGKPCVVTDVGDCAYLVADTGGVVAPGDVASLARAVLNLVSTESERRILGQRARERIANEFSLSKIVNEYGALYSRTASLARPSH